MPCGVEAGLRPVLVLINDQKFTKTANWWGVDNNSKGTPTGLLYSKNLPDSRWRSDNFRPALVMKPICEAPFAP